MMPPTEERLGSGGVVTVAGAAWSGNTRRINGRLVGVRIRPATASTIYSLRIVDKDDFEIYARKGLKGEHVEDLWPGAVVRGICTAYIEQATANEAFTFLLYLEAQ